MRTSCWLIVAALSAVLMACGQKGPLLLPDAQRPHKKIAVPKPPASTAPADAPAGGEQGVGAAPPQ